MKKLLVGLILLSINLYGTEPSTPSPTGPSPSVSPATPPGAPHVTVQDIEEAYQDLAKNGDDN